MGKTDQYSDSLTGNISEHLRINAAMFPDKPALLHPVRITYNELETEVDRYSYGLERAGIKSGTKTVLMIPAGPDMLYLTFALFRIQAVPVMIDPGMGISAMLKALEGIDADAFIGIPKAHLLRIIRPSGFRNVKVKLTILNKWFPGAWRARRFLGDEIKKYTVLMVDPDSMAAIFFTSGSTGPAKGVVYTAGMLNRQISITKEQFKISSDETDLCTFPLLGLFAICHGNSSVMADMDMVYPAKLNPSRVVRNIIDFGCTQMFGSPMILNRLSHYCTEKGIKLKTLRNVISAGAPVYKNILEEFTRLIADESVIHTPYGATEALPVTDITSAELAQLSEKPVDENGICIGYPIKGSDVRIIKISDDPIQSWGDDLLTSFGQVGEITIKGPWVSTEYFNNPDANRISKIHDHRDNRIWHRMGDLGRIDENGRLWFYGRKSQRVITENGSLFTIPCEAIFNRHLLVLRSALVGLPFRDRSLKKPAICIELKQGNHSSKQLKEELLKIGSSSKLTEDISDVFFFESFPVDPRHNAKIFREKLAMQAVKRIK
ncbi:MAG: fatty acid CoA ligase family protein [Bacteroidia bacterium]|nr:fatty acid CoA ligase family protein [Bacteroidia bacterium]